jgi:hypothetical protein
MFKNVGQLVITVDMKQSINECDHQQKINKQSNVGAAAVWPAVNEKQIFGHQNVKKA